MMMIPAMKEGVRLSESMRSHRKGCRRGEVTLWRSSVCGSMELMLGMETGEEEEEGG